MTKISFSKFKYCFVEPMEAAGYMFVYNPKPYSPSLSLHGLHKQWNEFADPLTEEPITKRTLPLKKLNKVSSKMRSLQKEVKGLSDFKDIEGALTIKLKDLNDQISAKKNLRQQSKVYPPEVQFFTYCLTHYWKVWLSTRKKISGFTPQMHEYRKILKDKKSRPVDKKLAKEGLLKIDVKANPGGAYIQRMLEVYYKKKYTNEQITTLLNMIDNWEDTDLGHGIKTNPNPLSMKVYDWNNSK